MVNVINLLPAELKHLKNALIAEMKTETSIKKNKIRSIAAAIVRSGMPYNPW